MIEEGYGKVLSRPHPEIGPRARELCVIPQLAALEAWPQLRSPAAGARRTGAAAGEIMEALRTGLRMAPGCDAPRARQETRRALVHIS
jgi:alkylhydroperoxidase/carboxymuconolactone decarboxylase family protein YurZ